jgi:hypothetical protein
MNVETILEPGQRPYETTIVQFTRDLIEKGDEKSVTSLIGAEVLAFLKLYPGRAVTVRIVDGDQARPVE